MVNRDGTPKVVYHATDAPEDFNQFERTEDIGFHFGTLKAANDRLEQTRGKRDAWLKKGPAGWYLENPDLHDPAEEWAAPFNRVYPTKQEAQKALKDGFSQWENARIIPAYLRIKNPVRLSNLHTWEPDEVIQALADKGVLTKDEAAHEWRTRRIVDRDYVANALAAKGYDGIVYRNKTEGIGTDSYIAFHPEQIKSATGNQGTFSLMSPNMLAATTGPFSRAKEYLNVNGKPAWAMVVDNADHAILGTVRAKKAIDADFHHTFYLPDRLKQKVADREATLVWADERGLQSMEPMPDAMRRALGQYLVPGTNEFSDTTEQTKTPAFKAWFGNSKVVNSDGTPKVVYHGTDTLFDKFDPHFLGAASDTSDAKAGFWFSSSLQRAYDAARDANAVSGTNVPYVVKTYLKLENPKVIPSIRGRDPADVARLAQVAKRQGYDGLIFSKGENGGSDYLVFDASHIQKAETPPQSGFFSDTTEPFSKAGAQTPGRFGKAVADFLGSDVLTTIKEKAQDYNARVERLQNDVDALAHGWIAPDGSLPDEYQIYQLKRLVPGKRKNVMREYTDQFIKPMDKLLRDNGISGREASDFLYARHAPERNRIIGGAIYGQSPLSGQGEHPFSKARRDPNIVGASGMSRKQADAIVNAALKGPKADAYRQIERQFGAMRRYYQGTLLRGGLESHETLAEWNRTYEHYAPLRGWEDPSEAPENADQGKGRGGGDIRGPESKQKQLYLRQALHSI